LEALLAAAELVTLLCPLAAETRHLISASSLARVKPGVLIVNASRGGLVDTEALLDALRSGQVAGAGLGLMEIVHPSALNRAAIQAPPAYLAATDEFEATRRG
jgi:phosphoglycerate dehydrogenase-like enzyme